MELTGARQEIRFHSAEHWARNGRQWSAGVSGPEPWTRGVSTWPTRSRLRSRRAFRCRETVMVCPIDHHISKRAPDGNTSREERMHSARTSLPLVGEALLQSRCGIGEEV